MRGTKLQHSWPPHSSQPCHVWQNLFQVNLQLRQEVGLLQKHMKGLKCAARLILDLCSIVQMGRVSTPGARLGPEAHERDMAAAARQIAVQQDTIATLKSQLADQRAANADLSRRLLPRAQQASSMHHAASPPEEQAQNPPALHDADQIQNLHASRCKPDQASKHRHKPSKSMTTGIHGPCSPSWRSMRLVRQCQIPDRLKVEANGLPAHDPMPRPV